MAKFNFKSYDDCCHYVRQLNLTCVREWWGYARSGERPTDIPSKPNEFYKGKGWVTWNDFLGSTNKQGGNHKYIINNDFFKYFTRDMFYIFGFWCADGYMNEKLNMFSITQHKDDKYLMENILFKMGATHNLNKHGDNSLMFDIRSTEIIKDIKKLGGVERKTHTLKFPNIPKEFI